MHDNVRALPASRLRATNTALPRMPAQHLARPRLTSTLLAEENRVRLIAAPAGFGKSVLLNECARRANSSTRVIWLDLLGHPLSPADFLERFAAALQLPYGEDTPQNELSFLLGRIAHQSVWIILDDYPRQPSFALDACIDYLLERSPDALHWWIAGRRLPAWSLPRLLLQGGLVELDANALTLTELELADFLEQRHLAPSNEQVAKLHYQSEGWLANICLKLMSKSSTDLPALLDRDSPLMQEYVEREILSELAPDLYEALLLLAHIPKFSSALCEHLLDEKYGPQVLEQLRQRQLFICPVDEQAGWFRLSRPLSNVLKRFAADHTLNQTHLLACQWFAQQGQAREAVEHALWAEQPETAANYLQRYGEDQLLVGHSVSQFLRWRDELPASLFASTPRLVILQAWALIICTRLDEVEACVTELSRFLPQPNAQRQQQLLAQYQVIVGVMQRQCGLASARQHCLEALEVLGEAAWSQQILCYQALSQQAASEMNLTLAQAYCQEGLRLSQKHGNILFETLLSIDHIHQLAMLGECQIALKQADQALQLLIDAGLRGPVFARLQLLRGDLLASRGDTDAAKLTLHAGIKEAEACEDAYQLFGYLALAELEAESGHLDLAQQLLDQAECYMQQHRIPEVRYCSALGLAQAALWRLQGDLAKAQQSALAIRQQLESDHLLLPSGFYDLLLRARLCLTRIEIDLGNVEHAQAELLSLLSDCQGSGHLSLATQVQLCLAQFLEDGDAHESADLHLSAALLAAQRQQQISPVLALKKRQPQWLDEQLLANEALAILRHQVRSASEGLTDDPVSFVRALSKREIAVLGLISKGYSNQQVAEALYISLHTVKSHARRINTKLGVQRRTHAVALAKEQGLID
ncbi:LuxR C-terminal-related transcriptional regulator [Pseudomonas sp. EL_65y_Pfl2_R95]|uniref:LuxR C-terminal-related transcriptional regulator n=1 Tax=Pseudomonas sp. EL_65y_Pfl2_R95 TaxID=3088698 RepID=UPI0030D8EDA9